MHNHFSSKYIFYVFHLLLDLLSSFLAAQVAARITYFTTAIEAFKTSKGST